MKSPIRLTVRVRHQKYLAEKQYYVIQSIGNTAVFAQPWVRDYYPQADYGAATEVLVKMWFDGKPQ